MGAPRPVQPTPSDTPERTLADRRSAPLIASIPLIFHRGPLVPPLVGQHGRRADVVHNTAGRSRR